MANSDGSAPTNDDRPIEVAQIAIDIGGTFTDAIMLLTSGEVRTNKFLSSIARDPRQLSELLAGWIDASRPSGTAALSSRSEKRVRVVHGTTVATNALLERRLARTALVTTRGFGDVIELGRGMRADPIDLQWRPPEPLVDREGRFAIDERIASDGEVLEKLELTDALRDKLVRKLRSYDAVAIALLNSYRNPAHEEAVKELVARALPDLFVSASHAVDPEIGEYERTSTTVINSALGPVVAKYLDALETTLQSVIPNSEIEVMQSAGGTVSLDYARTRPVTIVESGPAAGVIAACAVSRSTGLDRVVALDMGGTTAKASLVEDCQAMEVSEYYVGGSAHVGPVATSGTGYVIRVPSVDVVEVGAGGGSIAWVDEAGGVQVGPQSAGASPGPACYGLGGTEATVTDANVVLGYISPVSIAGGLQRIDVVAAQDAVERSVAEPLGLSSEDAALLIHVAANARMLRVLRAVTTEKGRDARKYTLVAFGGSGAVHAAGMADLIGVRHAIVPFAAGILSAAGLLVSGAAIDVIESLGRPLLALTHDDMTETIERLRSRLRDEYRVAPGDAAASEVLVSMRMGGQYAELTVPFLHGERGLEELGEEFRSRYGREFGFVLQLEQCEVTGVRLRLRLPPTVDWESISQAHERMLSAQQRPQAGDVTRICVFRSGMVNTAVFRGEDLMGSSQEVVGPAVVELPDTTVLVPPEWSARAETGTGIVLWR